jgi:hypothetical protein
MSSLRQEVLADMQETKEKANRMLKGERAMIDRKELEEIEDIDPTEEIKKEFKKKEKRKITSDNYWANLGIKHQKKVR